MDVDRFSPSVYGLLVWIEWRTNILWQYMNTARTDLNHAPVSKDKVLFNYTFQ